ncbi:MAG: lipopolysaccharide biosynthesis protein [Roseiflexaceae bacterium]|nr:lipopolysaccharide biosynthesis protein [Roseiflexaceae bacterium]
MVRLALLKLLESFFRHRWLYLLPILLMAVAAGISVMRAKPLYSSSGSLYIQSGSLVKSLNDLPSASASWWVTPSQVTVNQIRELLQTEAFVRPVVKGTPFETTLNGTPDQLGEAIKAINKSIVVATAGDNLVTFSAEYQDAQVAYQLARQLPESYVLWKLNSDRQDSLAAQSFFGDLVAPYQKQLDTARSNLQSYIEANPAPVRGDRPELERIEINRLQGEVTQAQTRVEEVRQKEESARLAQIQAERGVRQTYLIIDAPKQPTLRVNGLRTLLLSNILFLVIGVILSVVGVIGSAVLDRSLRFPMESTLALHLPVIAMIPKVRMLRDPMPVGNQRTAPSEEHNTDTPAIVQREERSVEVPAIVQPPLTTSLAQSSNE